MEILDKNILVTGGAGFIGSHIVDKLVKIKENSSNKNGKIVAIDNLESGDLNNLKKSLSNIYFKKIDVRDKNKLKELILGDDIDIIFHLAASANVPYSVKHRDHDFQCNTVGTFNILDVSIDASVEKIIYASSAAVYGEPKYTPINEEHPLKPISPYGASKLCGEMLGFTYYKTYGLPFISLRIFNTYGPRQTRYVMYDFIKKLINNPYKLEILGTGEQLRDFCYISDCVNAFILASEKDEMINEAYNVAGGNEISIKELAKIIIECMGLSNKTKLYFTGESWKGDINRLIADISKIKKMGFNPSTRIRDGVSMLVEWFKSEQIHKRYTYEEESHSNWD